MSSTTSPISKPLSINALTDQQQALITAVYEDNRLVIAQAGFGKTVCAQTAAQELIDDGCLNRVLVVAPLKVCQLTWATEYFKWQHLWPVACAFGAGEAARKAAIDSDEGVVILNLENLVWFFNTYGAGHGFDGLIVDEGSKLKNPGSAAFKALRHRLKDFSWRTVMSATPVHESALDIYTQMMIVDNGKTLGRNFDAFKQQYFMQMDYKGYQWEFQPFGVERLAKDIQAVTYITDTGDYEERLPSLEDVIVPVKLPENARRAYSDFCKDLLSTVNGTDVYAVNAAVQQSKLQQVCCGAVYDDNNTAQWLHTAKFIRLAELIREINEPVVIVYQFRYELDELRKRYPKALVLADDPKAVAAAWNTGKEKILLVHPKTAGHGVNLQYGGCRLIVLSPFWSADQWDQLVRRLRRQGQPSPVVWRYILLVEDSVERLILERHGGKMSNAESFIAHLKHHTAH